MPAQQSVANSDEAEMRPSPMHTRQAIAQCGAGAVCRAPAECRQGKIDKTKRKKKLFVFFCLSFLTAFMGGVEGIFSGIVSFQLIQTVVSFSEAVSGWESPSMNECTD